MSSGRASPDKPARKSTIGEQIEHARREVKKLKRAAPYLFPEYARLCRAERWIKQARDELIAARKAWREL